MDINRIEKRETNPLCYFSQEMVDMLVKEARSVLEYPSFDKIEYAYCLLQDALRYDSLYYLARGVINESYLEAAQKLRKRDTV